MNELKIGAISDIHGNLVDITEECDVFIIAGDIIPLEIQFNKQASKDWFENEFTEWANNIPAKSVVIIGGNHDAYLEEISNANKLAICNKCKKLTILRNELKHIYDDNLVVWTIFGTPYCHQYGTWPFMRSEEILKDKFSAIPDSVDIVVSHDAPFSFGDCDLINKDRAKKHCIKPNVNIHLGNKELAYRLINVDYKIAICGHIHGGDHNYNEKYKNVNVSALDEDYNINWTAFYRTITK